MSALLKIVAACGLCIAAVSPAAADYPSRPIRYVTGSGPGNVADVVARAFAEKLALRLRQPVVVENRPGAVGLIALNTVLSAEPCSLRLRR
ncbi:MAG TPA: hypothetical protein VLK85_27505 [Ramlibacter sp.]|nr:hypothetical protein [Ramlibacter sp.]